MRFLPYLQSDVFLLADVFRNFRDECLKTYELDPAQFLTLPNLAWEASLKITSIKLGLFTGQEMLLLIKEGVRVGLTQVLQKYCVANNKYMQSYDKNKRQSYLRYLDVNSLCAWAMCNKLAIKNFEWVKDLRYIN